MTKNQSYYMAVARIKRKENLGTLTKAEKERNRSFGHGMVNRYKQAMGIGGSQGDMEDSINTFVDNLMCCNNLL